MLWTWCARDPLSASSTSLFLSSFATHSSSSSSMYVACWYVFFVIRTISRICRVCVCLRVAFFPISCISLFVIARKSCAKSHQSLLNGGVVFVSLVYCSNEYTVFECSASLCVVFFSCLFDQTKALLVIVFCLLLRFLFIFILCLSCLLVSVWIFFVYFLCEYVGDGDGGVGGECDLLVSIMYFFFLSMMMCWFDQCFLASYFMDRCSHHDDDVPLFYSVTKTRLFPNLWTISTGWKWLAFYHTAHIMFNILLSFEKSKVLKWKIARKQCHTLLYTA